jgi:uncharacterized protein YvpB
MVQWIIIFLLLIIIILYYLSTRNNKAPQNNLGTFGSSNSSPDWLVQAEKDYGDITFPQAADELGSLGYPKSEIDKSKVIIQSNLDQNTKDNLESLEEKKKDPRSNPPRYGVTIASIYPPEEFLSNNTGLKVYLPPPPQSGQQPPLASSFGVVVVPDKTKILPNLNYSNLTGGIKFPVYNQSQCGCCWVVSCAATLNYHIFKQTNKLERIVYSNLYTFCVKPNQPRGFSRQSQGCRGGIPTDVFVDINNSKTLATFPNATTNLLFKQQDNQCQNMLRQQQNPLLQVKSDPFAAKGVIALYQDGKFYYNKEVTDPRSFLPTSRLTTFNQNQIDTIKYLLCVNGPLVVGMNAARTRNITQYKSGIATLPGGTPDHAVILIGYQDNYWIIQNSWSEKWGMNGLMYADIRTSHLTMITALVTDYTELGKLYQ